MGVSSRWLLLAPLAWLAFGNHFVYLAGAEFSDLTISHLSNLMFLRRAVVEWGQVPLWSPGILSGHPFAANPLSGLWYPPGWLGAVWPAPWAFNLLAALHLVWGGVGMYLWLRREGLGERAATLGGLALAFMPKLAAHYAAGHITLVYAVAWTPWLLLVSCRAGSLSEERAGAGVWPGVILAVMFYADVRWAAMAGLLWGARWAVGCGIFAHSQINRGEGGPAQAGGGGGRGNFRFGRMNFRAAAPLVGQCVLAAMLAAPLGLPLIELTRFSTRAEMSAEDALVYSLPPARLLGLLFPEFGGVQEWVVYPGAAVVLLAVSGLAFSEVRRRTRFWWAVFLGAVLLSLGDQLPWTAWMANLAGMNLLRVPARWMFAAGIALAALAAHGLDRLEAGVGAEERRRVARGLVFVGGLAGMIAGGVWVLAGQLPLNFAWGAGMVALSAAGVGWMSRAQRLRAGRAGALLIGLMLLDLGVVQARGLSPRSAEEVFAEGREAAAFLASQPGRFRVYSPSYSLPQHTAARFGLELADGVDPLQLSAYAWFMWQATGVPQGGYHVTLPPLEGDPLEANAEYLPDARALGLLNVRFVAAEFDLKAEGLTLIRQFGRTRVYENGYARPRAWLEGAGLPAADILTWSPNRIVLEGQGPGLLVLSELAYPGWRVWVDGQAADWEPAWGVLRGVQLPPGPHRVVFEFRPLSLYLGCGLFAAALAFLAARGKLRRGRR